MFKGNRSQSGGERTAEERQRAREERERRRGVAVPAPATPADEEPAPAENLAPEQPGAGEEPPTVEHALPEEPAPPLEPVSEEFALPPVPAEEPSAAGLPSEELPPLPEAEPPTPSPSPSRRDSRMTRRVERLREQRASSHSWQRRLAVRLGALLALAGVVVAVWALAQSQGSSAPKQPALPRIVKVTIPEGFTRAQIAALAKADGLRGDYLAASVRSSLLHPTRYGAPRGTPTLEGFLFPATYDLYSTASAKHLVDEQLLAFRENFGAVEIHRAHALGVTPYELLTVASLIEREAEVERDRPLIAAVIYNRLRLNMPLGIDASIRYALNDFSKPLTEAQLRTPSPYNTRLHTGLPPTPIGNPGLASIHAAAHPAQVSYLYYVAGADGCGEHVFSNTFAEFERNAAAYREAVAKNHGQVPTCHKK
ncbi:MAG: endolytic transglycosylase MltG [Solirubrobacterales bacterium]